MNNNDRLESGWGITIRFLSSWLKTLGLSTWQWRCLGMVTMFKVVMEFSKTYSVKTHDPISLSGFSDEPFP
jgi:hypothetical protein